VGAVGSANRSWRSWRRGSGRTGKVDMPFQEKPDIVTPPDDTVVWRYLSFFAFVEMIQRGKLRFTRADKFKDPLEGTQTDAEISAIRVQFANKDLKLKDVPIPLLANHMAPILSYVSCWREGDQESMAMWDLYSRGNGTVAVASTIGLIKEVLQQESQLCSMGRVKYIPWATHRDADIDPLSICFRKDSSYEHEAEIRAVIHEWSLFDAELTKAKAGDTLSGVFARTPGGIDLTIDLSRFVIGVVVGPEAHSRSEELVMSIVEHYQLPWRVRPSLLLKKR
jgi:hypothetical protein